jgi:hypothetical protein
MSGVDLYCVKEFLGHRDIETTLWYARLAPGHLQEAVNKGNRYGIGSKTGSEEKGSQAEGLQPREKVVRPEGLEPPTF